MIEVKAAIEPGCEDIPLPDYQTPGSSGMDLHAAVDMELHLKIWSLLLILPVLLTLIIGVR